MSLKWESFPDESSNLSRAAIMVNHYALVIHCSMTYPRRYFSILYYSVTSIWLTSQDKFSLGAQSNEGVQHAWASFTANTL
jgi:hypothetical protein